MTEPPIHPIVPSRSSLAERTIGDVTILELAGPMTLGDEEQLRTAVTRLIDTGSVKLVLDLTQLMYLDSAGLGELVRSYTSVKHANGELSARRSLLSSNYHLPPSCPAPSTAPSPPPTGA